VVENDILGEKDEGAGAEPRVGAPPSPSGAAVPPPEVDGDEEAPEAASTRPEVIEATESPLATEATADPVAEPDPTSPPGPMSEPQSRGAGARDPDAPLPETAPPAASRAEEPADGHSPLAEASVPDDKPTGTPDMMRSETGASDVAPGESTEVAPALDIDPSVAAPDDATGAAWLAADPAPQTTPSSEVEGRAEPFPPAGDFAPDLPVESGASEAPDLVAEPAHVAQEDAPDLALGSPQPSSSGGELAADADLGPAPVAPRAARPAAGFGDRRAAPAAADHDQRVEFEGPRMRTPEEAVREDWLVARIGAAAEAHTAALPPPVADRPPEVPTPSRFEPPAGAPLRRGPSYVRSVAAPASSAGSTAAEARDFTPAWGEPAAPPAAPSDFERRKAEAWQLVVTAARYAAYAVAGYLALTLVLIALFRFVNPPGSALMLIRWLGGAEIHQSWVPLERISPQLVRAVIVAEDGRFCDHWGIDLEAVEQALERAADGAPRGASTISMQVVKNMFLWPSKSYLRKAIEVPLTLVMELVWPKWRILEIYLNVAEWGPGVFGAEAAAAYHFNKPAARVGEREAALLAASLPNPVRRDAGAPGPRTSRKAGVIGRRMRAAGAVAACVTER
jgi:monofunctional biosynthetic peptidoglycan transglycosylase